MNWAQRVILLAGASLLLVAAYTNAIGEYGVGPADNAWLATVQLLCAVGLLFAATGGKKKEGGE